MAENVIYDTIIIGGGPAGLAAGIYSARARMKTLLIESFSIMGQATMTDLIENYPGIEKATGFELINVFKKQALGFGLEETQGTVKKIFKQKTDSGELWCVEDENATYQAVSLIVASGAKARKIGIPGEEEFVGKGVSYCGTCDGPFFREKDLVVIGGGDTAVEEAVYLTKFAKKVTLVHRRDRLRATKILQELIFANKKVEIKYESCVEKISGDGKVGIAVIKNLKTGEVSDLECNGVFIFVGWDPNTDFVKGVVALNEKEYIKADKDMKTNADGIFACGDCCDKILRQVVTACGDGAVASYSAQHYVESLKGTEYV